MPSSKPEGRPTKYKKNFPDRVRKMVRLTHYDMAKNLGIAVSTFCEYMKEYPEFAEAVNEADAATNSIVESSMFQAANGYSHDDTDIRVVDGKIVMTPIVKHYPPNPSLAIFWAKNKMGWKDKQDIEHSGKITGVVQLPDEEEE